MPRSYGAPKPISVLRRHFGRDRGMSATRKRGEHSGTFAGIPTNSERPFLEEEQEMQNEFQEAYRRLLKQYEEKLLELDRAIESDIEDAREAIRNDLRFHPRHKLQEFGKFVCEFEAKMQVFDDILLVSSEKFYEERKKS